MKICSACRTQYSDDTLRFCLQDGTPLAGGFGTDTPTIVLGETETVTSQSGRENVPYSEQWQQSQVTHVAKPKPEKRGSNTAIAVAATAFGMLLLFGVVGIGAWLFLKNGQPEIAKNTVNNSNAANQNFNVNALPPPNTQGSPSPTQPTSTPIPASTIATSKPVDDSQVRSEVSQKIYNWKSLTESKDMNSLRASYADRLDYYYTRRNVSSGTVIADKQRAFRNYNSLRINVEILSVTPDASGDSATALYNKDWSFSGRKPFCGNIRSQMQLRKINGVWLITGEKDVPGTFRRTC